MPSAPSRFSPLTALLAALAFGSLIACAAHIGDKCRLSTDCSTQGTRLCDTSEPNGYCTVFNCGEDDAGNGCPDHAVCIEFNPGIPGCPYSDISPSSMGQTFCMKHCTKDSDCRQSDGYICADPRNSPWNAFIIDNDQSQKVCIVAPDVSMGPIGAGEDYDASVCWGVWPDAGFPVAADASVSSKDAGVDSAGDASTDAMSDAVTDAETAEDAAGDATLGDAGSGDGSADATLGDATVGDAGTSDATTGDATFDAGEDGGESDAGENG